MRAAGKSHVDAIEGRGEIRSLTTNDHIDGVSVEVRDTGSGMTDEVKRRICEPFYTTKPVGQGTGLGLSLSFSIIQKHGERIEVDSEPGVGTAFRIWIPIKSQVNRRWATGAVLPCVVASLLSWHPTTRSASSR